MFVASRWLSYGLYLLLMMMIVPRLWAYVPENQTAVTILSQITQTPANCTPITSSQPETLLNWLHFFCGEPLAVVSTPTVIDLYTTGLAYLQAGNVAEAIPPLQAVQVSSQAILYLRTNPTFSQDATQLANLATVAAQLVPFTDMGQNPYRDILGAISDYLAWEMPDQAAALHELIARYESPAALRYWLSAAEAARLHGDMDRSDEFLQTAKQMWPQERILHQRHGQLLLQDNRWAAAIVAGQEWLQYFPADARAMYQIGHACYRAGELALAKTWLEQAVANLSETDEPLRATIQADLTKISEQ